jgi:hypothetical protein
MSRTSTIRRGAAALGVSGLIALTLAGPAAARPDPGTGERPQCTSGCYEGGATSSTQIFRVDDNAVEFLQLGAGVLAGIALAGAGLAVASRRSHAHHPTAA